MVWRCGGIVAFHKIWLTSMQRFLRNLSIEQTDDGGLRHDSSSADRVKHGLQFINIQKLKFKKKKKTNKQTSTDMKDTNLSVKYGVNLCRGFPGKSFRGRWTDEKDFRVFH